MTLKKMIENLKKNYNIKKTTPLEKVFEAFADQLASDALKDPTIISPSWESFDKTISKKYNAARKKKAKEQDKLDRAEKKRAAKATQPKEPETEFKFDGDGEEVITFD